MDNFIGIDLGTSTTCVAVVKDDQPVVIPDPIDNRVMPSFVHVREDGRVLVGEPARSEGVADPYNTIWATKRLIGRRFEDPMVQEFKDRFPFRIGSGPNGSVSIEARGKTLSPEWVASILLKSAVAQASRFLGEPVKKAVVAVPGTFTKEQREATTRAAGKIGLDVLRLLNEPTAAALAWGFHQNANQTIAVFDLGGGTLDVAVIKVGDGGYKLLAHGGESWLGGEDFDQAVMDRVVADFKDKHRINIYRDKMAQLRLKYAAERAKIELTGQDSARLFLPAICPDLSRVADVNYELTRAEFERLVGPLVDKAVRVFKGAVEKAGLDMDGLDNVVLVGGMTRAPLIRAKIKEALGRPGDISINPDEAVALGAAINAAGFNGKQLSMSPPMSTKPADEYLSGDVDVQAMYAQALIQNGDEESSAAPAGYPGAEVPGSAPVAPPPLPNTPNGGTGVAVQITSPLLPSAEVAKILIAARESSNGGEWTSGGFRLVAGGGEEVRIRVMDASGAAEGHKVVGEFVIQTYPAGEGYPSGVNVYFSVEKKAPFAMKGPAT